MGKHSDPQQQNTSIFEHALKAMTLPGAQQKDKKATATGVLKAVRRRPRLAALVVPVAAGAAVVTSATLVNTEGASDAQVVAETTETAAVDYQASDAVAVGDAKQDFASFAAGASGVGAQAAPKPEPKQSKSAPSAGKATSSSKAKAGSGSADTESKGGGSGSVSYEACSVSSSIESGLSENARKVYRAVCANYPQVKSYGGKRNDPGSDHNTGHAVDVMIRGSVGDDITEFLIKNHAELGVSYVIWEQKIFAPYTGWKGRPMKNRGNDTANHFDHVHVSVH